jgi:hypothetical protein
LELEKQAKLKIELTYIILCLLPERESIYVITAQIQEYALPIETAGLS